MYSYSVFFPSMQTLEFRAAILSNDAKKARECWQSQIQINPIDVNFVYGKQKTLLYQLVHENKYKEMQLFFELVDKNPNFTAGNAAVLHEAARKENIFMLRLLMENGADLFGFYRCEPSLLCMLAEEKIFGCLHAVLFWQKKKVCVGQQKLFRMCTQRSQFFFSLGECTKNDNWPAVRLLLKSLAEKRICNLQIDGEKLFEQAVANGSKKVAQYLQRFRLLRHQKFWLLEQRRRKGCFSSVLHYTHTFNFDNGGDKENKEN